MNIVIPLAGIDRELEAAGIYKPLVEIAGRPLIRHCTDQYPELFASGKNTLIFLVLAEHEQKFEASKKLREIYGKSAQVRIIPEPTEGAACTVLSAKELIENDEELIIYLADIYFEADIAAAIARCKKEKLAGFIPCFPSSHKKYSYAVSGRDGLISRVAEKEVISTNASAGFYYFSRGSNFILAAEEMIRKNLRVNGAFYICPVYNELVGRGKGVLMLPAHYKFGLGNLAEIRTFKKTAESEFPRTRQDIFAHRGIFDAKNPENSFGALSNAVIGGYSIELDVRKTADGVLVISHDSNLERGFGKRGKIEEKNYSELSSLDYFSPGSRIAKFDEFLAYFKAESDYRTELAIHAKSYDEKLGSMIAKALLLQTLTERAFVFDISRDDARKLKAECPFIRIGASIVDDEIKKKTGYSNYFTEEEMAGLDEFDILWIDEWMKLYSVPFLRKASATSKEIVAISPELHGADGNTTPPEKTWAKLINSGCTKICTDYPIKLDAFLVR